MGVLKSLVLPRKSNLQSRQRKQRPTRRLANVRRTKPQKQIVGRKSKRNSSDSKAREMNKNARRSLRRRNVRKMTQQGRMLPERRLLNVLPTKKPPDGLRRIGNARRPSLTFKLQPQLQEHGVQTLSKKRREKKRGKKRKKKKKKKKKKS